MNTVIFPEDVANAVQSAYLQTEDEDVRNLLLSVGAELPIKHQSEELSEFLRLILEGADTACNETLSTLSKEASGCVDAIRP